MTLEGLDRFIPKLVEWGATSAELVLHHGSADDQIARVHILESDWKSVGDRFVDASLQCNVHAPLHPRFSLRRWRGDRRSLEAGYLPIFREALRLAERQSRDCVVVVHGANDGAVSAVENARSTTEFLGWASERCLLEFPGVQLALELRKSSETASRNRNGERTQLVDLIEKVGAPKVGICWDFGHDWENRILEPNWAPRPDMRFLRHVKNVHAHDAGPTGLPHYPLTTGLVPIDEMTQSLVEAGYDGAITLELRYRFAAEVGEPHEVMRLSFERMNTILNREP